MNVLSWFLREAMQYICGWWSLHIADFCGKLKSYYGHKIEKEEMRVRITAFSLPDSLSKPEN